MIEMIKKISSKRKTQNKEENQNYLQLTKVLGELNLLQNHPKIINKLTRLTLQIEEKQLLREVQVIDN